MTTPLAEFDQTQLMGLSDANFIEFLQLWYSRLLAVSQAIEKLEVKFSRLESNGHVDYCRALQDRVSAEKRKLAELLTACTPKEKLIPSFSLTGKSELQIVVKDRRKAILEFGTIRRSTLRLREQTEVLISALDELV